MTSDLPSSTATEPARSKFPISRVIRLALSLFLVVYLADAVWFQLRASFPRLGRASGSVHRTRLLAIPDKGNKIEYQIDALQPEEDVPCANTLFPHAAQNPCWYVARHARDPIQM
jgi:hypothetical protein